MKIQNIHSKQIFIFLESRIFIQNKYSLFWNPECSLQKLFIFFKSRRFIQTKYLFFYKRMYQPGLRAVEIIAHCGRIILWGVFTRNGAFMEECPGQIWLENNQAAHLAIVLVIMVLETSDKSLVRYGFAKDDNTSQEL